MKSNRKVVEFVDLLEQYNTSEDAFNPWKDYNKKYDIGPESVGIRKNNLVKYLTLRVPNAKFILVAEALGYQGGRFTGIAMTSERMITGNHEMVSSKMVFSGTPGLRTSVQNIPKPNSMQERFGFAEPTASIVWQEILNSGIDPKYFILWNIYPFHPFKPTEGMMTNRTPRKKELKEGVNFANHLFSLNPDAKIIAIGKKAADTLTSCNVTFTHVPHPANSKAESFRTEFNRILNQ